MKGPSIYSFVKRPLDIIGAILILMILSPVFLLAMIGILLDGTGGGIFLESPLRVGMNGNQFRMLKFRTMVPGAHAILESDPSLSKLRKKMRNNGKLAIDEDPRITKVGKILRRWDIDEIPQLINVLVGEMSIVGPRPYLKTELEPYAGQRASNAERVDVVLRVRPGVTGSWQVSGRNDIRFDKRIKIDEEYSCNVNFFDDLRILLRTPYVVAFRIGAW